MARGFLPIVAGGLLGATIATVLLRHAGADGPPAAPADPLLLAELSGLDDRAGANPVSSPDELAAIADPLARRVAALALLADAGDATAVLDRVASALPPDEEVSFRVHAIVNLGATDMQAAIAAAAALPQHEQRRLALLRLAPVLARSDPAGAVASIGDIGAPDLATEFGWALFDAWAELDPAALFDYLESSDTSLLPMSAPAFQGLAASDPERLLALAEDLRRGHATLATTAALDALMQQDAAAVLSYLADSPPGNALWALGQRAAEAYARQNPEAAWSWAEETQADAGIRMSVVGGIHSADPDMAWEIMQSLWNSADADERSRMRDSFLGYVSVVVNSESTDDITTGLDRLLGLGDPSLVSNLRLNVGNWADRDPEAAIDWSLRNLDRIDASSILTALGASVARSSPNLARQTTFRLAEQHQPSWVAGVVRNLAANDLAAAEAWAFEFPNGSLRDAGLHEVIFGQARGGTVDRQLFGLISTDTARGEAASRAARRLGCDGQMALALELATAYITDRSLLAATRQGIERDNSSSRSPICQLIR